MPYFWISSQIPPRQVKRLSVIPKDLHLSSKAGDGKFTPVLPLCSSPRLPIANVHSSAWRTARHMQAEREKHTFPPWLFSSFFFFFAPLALVTKLVNHRCEASARPSVSLRCYRQTQPTAARHQLVFGQQNQKTPLWMYLLVFESLALFFSHCAVVIIFNVGL